MTDIPSPTSNIVDDDELVHHDDPGGHIHPFGQFAGKRLDEVPNNLRRWATGAKCQENSWYVPYKQANDRYEEFLLQTPEAYPFPFGEHLDKRLDQVPEDITWYGIHPLRSNNVWYQNLAEANRRYLNKLYDTKSPGSVEIWFGTQYKGYRLDAVYSRPGFIRFCLNPERKTCNWYYRFEDLVRRYQEHLVTHRRPYCQRRPPHVENPTGELLGKLDDGRGSVEPDDDYDRDDFVVDDDDIDEESYEEEGSDFESDNNINDLAVDDDGQDQLQEEYHESQSKADCDADVSISQIYPLSLSPAKGDSASRSDSGDDTPLDKLRDKIRSKRPSEKTAEESDDIVQPSPKRLKRRSKLPKGHRLVHGPHSDTETGTVSELGGEPESTHHCQLYQSVRALSLSQESAASPSPRFQGQSGGRDDNDISGYDTSCLGSRYRIVIDSDGE